MIRRRPQTRSRGTTSVARHPDRGQGRRRRRRLSTSFGAAGSIRPATELWRYAAVAVYSFHIRACHEQSSAMLGAVTCLTTCRDFSPLHPRVMYGGG